MTTQLSHSANQSPAAPAPPSEAPPPGRPAGILPMPAQMLAASNGGGPLSMPATAQQDSTGRGAVPTTGGGDNAAEGPLQKESNNMANTKEKTPMCLLNELARFNKLQPKYELITEKGPPHEKVFTVCLTLGSQTYESSGASIKKAQHGAAASALEKCGLPHPVPRNNPPKFKRRNIIPNTDAMTPTVKLNSLAMKTGKQVQYVPLNPIQPRPFYGGGYRGPRNQGMPHPNHQDMPSSQQQQQHQGGQHPPAFHPPGPPQMPPPPMPQQQGQGPPPPPGMAQSPPMPAQSPGGMNQQQTGQQGGPPSPQPNQGQQQQPQQQQEHDQQQQQHPHPGGQPYHNQQHRPYFSRYPRPYVHLVKVTVGDREFVGEGKTQKAARQNAAFRALTSLDTDPNSQKVDQATTTNVPVVEGNGDATNGEEKNVKSDISLVYEAANLHDLNVVFKVLEEKGQPHLKIFKLQCCVGDFTTEADGPSKKDAKRKAAELMLPKVKGLPPVPAKVLPPYHMQRQLWRQDKTNKKKKSKSLLKTMPSDPNFGAPGLHPVSRLVQILQAKNEREPEFSVIEERPLMERAGPHMVRRREFTMQVTAASETATGKGKTKKDAKKLAAENMLKVLGYSPTPDETNGVPGSAAQPSKSALKTPATTTSSKVVEEADRKVTFKDEKQKQAAKMGKDMEGSGPIGHGGKGLAPGLLPMMPGVSQQPQMFPSGPAPPSAHKLPGQGLNRAPGGPVTSPNVKGPNKNQNLSDIARDLLSLGHSPTAEALLKGTSGPHAIPNLSRPTQQLEYLANVNALTIKFNDYPKQGNKSECQSVVYLTTDPQSAFRGSGPTEEAAHDAAAITALRVLAGIADGDGGKKAGGR